MMRLKSVSNQGKSGYLRNIYNRNRTKTGRCVIPNTLFNIALEKTVREMQREATDIKK